MADFSIPSLLLGAAAAIFMVAVIREYVFFRFKAIKTMDDIAAQHSRIGMMELSLSELSFDGKRRHDEYIEQFDANGRAFIKINESVINLESRLFPPDSGPVDTIQTIMATYGILREDYIQQGFSVEEAEAKASLIVMDKLAESGLTESIGVTDEYQSS